MSHMASTFVIALSGLLVAGCPGDDWGPGRHWSGRLHSQRR